MMTTAITQTNAKSIAYKLRQGIENGGLEREALAAYLEWVAESLATDDSIIDRLQTQLRKVSDELTDAVHRAQEAEHAYGLLVKQVDASHAENAQLREQLRKTHITTIARVYSGEPLDCEGDGSGPGCEHAALWEIQAMDSSGSHYSYVCADHLDDYQKWAEGDGRMPLVFETD